MRASASVWAAALVVYHLATCLVPTASLKVVGSLRPGGWRSWGPFRATSDGDGTVVGDNSEGALFWTDLQSLATLPELQRLLSLVVLENEEAVRYANIASDDGEEVARKNRKTLFDASYTDGMVACFTKLDLFVTNAALDMVRSRLAAESKVGALSFMAGGSV
jgi:hypothetical protein